MGRKYRRKVSELIQVRLADLLEHKVKDPRLQMVTITGVKVTPDVARADVRFSVLGGEEARKEAQEGLDSAASWLRRELGRGLRLRQTPALVFHYDRSLEHSERIADILDELDLGDEKEHDAETG